jgi:hypothetical protein
VRLGEGRVDEFLLSGSSGWVRLLMTGDKRRAASKNERLPVRGLLSGLTVYGPRSTHPRSPARTAEHRPCRIEESPGARDRDSFARCCM